MAGIMLPQTLRPAPSHLNDAHANVYRPPEHNFILRIKGDLQGTGAVTDVEGGWWDAGDYLKFVHTTSFAEALMLAGVRDFPAQMGTGAATDFAVEAKFGLDWLLKMWDDRTATPYYQVGIGTGNWGFEDDHSVWRLPQVDDTYGGNDPQYRYIRHRPVLLAGPPGSKVSPNLAGRLAADFALGSSIFRANNPAFANRCPLAAQHVLDLADTATSGELLTASPHDFYDESEWRDDLELAATEIYLAMRNPALPPGLPHTDANFYLNAAARWAGEYMHAHPDGGDLLGVTDVSGKSRMSNIFLVLFGSFGYRG